MRQHPLLFLAARCAAAKVLAVLVFALCWGCGPGLRETLTEDEEYRITRDKLDSLLPLKEQLAESRRAVGLARDKLRQSEFALASARLAREKRHLDVKQSKSRVELEKRRRDAAGVDRASKEEALARAALDGASVEVAGCKAERTLRVLTLTAAEDQERCAQAKLYLARAKLLEAAVGPRMSRFEQQVQACMSACSASASRVDRQQQVVAQMEKARAPQDPGPLLGKAVVEPAPPPPPAPPLPPDPAIPNPFAPTAILGGGAGPQDPTGSLAGAPAANPSDVPMLPPLPPLPNNTR